MDSIYNNKKYINLMPKVIAKKAKSIANIFIEFNTFSNNKKNEFLIVCMSIEYICRFSFPFHINYHLLHQHNQQYLSQLAILLFSFWNL